VLFLALYLLLLAFFIMLTALSSLERQRADAVMDSLTLTFAPGRAARETEMGLEDLTGERQAAEAFIALVTDLFQSAVPAIRVTETIPGLALEVRLRAEALFEPGTDILRRPRRPMLDSVVAALAGAPPGLRFEMAVIAEVAEDQDANGIARLPTDGEALPIRRAGAIGRFMNDRGAAQGSVVVGLTPGNPDWMRIAFRTVDATRWDPDFSTVPPDAVTIDAPAVPGDDARVPPETTQGGAQIGENDVMIPASSETAPRGDPMGLPVVGSARDHRPALPAADGDGLGGTSRGENGRDTETSSESRTDTAAPAMERTGQ